MACPESTLTAVHPGGAVDARRHSDGSTITLPADCLAEHTHLAYATTAHRAQGMTADVCHAAITADTSHEQLYVAATRGRNGNHLWVVVDSDRDVVRDRHDLPAPEEILSRGLQRRDVDRLSAHQAIADSLREVSSPARLGAIFEDAARSATDRWLRYTLTDRGLAEAIDDGQWPSLIARVRQTALAGHDVGALLDEAIVMRPIIGDAHSTAAVLHWRVGVLAATPAPRGRGPLASLPPTDGPVIDVARQTGELIRQRWHDLRAAHRDHRPAALGPGTRSTATESGGGGSLAQHHTAVTAYRERYEVPEHTQMLGPRPAASRPDARAAWDHACHQADRYLARRLHHLDEHELADLDARQPAIIDNPHRSTPSNSRGSGNASTRSERGGTHIREGPAPSSFSSSVSSEQPKPTTTGGARPLTPTRSGARNHTLDYERWQRESCIRSTAVRLGR